MCNSKLNRECNCESSMICTWNQQEFVDCLILQAKTETLKRDLQTISDKLWEQIDHTLLTEMMCVIVENEYKISDLIE